jgi:hypothetical protein
MRWRPTSPACTVEFAVSLGCTPNEHSSAPPPPCVPLAPSTAADPFEAVEVACRANDVADEGLRRVRCCGGCPCASVCLCCSTLFPTTGAGNPATPTDATADVATVARSVRPLLILVGESLGMRESRCPGGGDSVVLVVTLSAVRTDGGISTASHCQAHAIQKLSGCFFCGQGKETCWCPLPNHLYIAFISPLLEVFKGLRVLSLGMDHNCFR